ncbi:citrate lyase holo-[acyl-carrier protein] synthase [Psychrilyobacter piezotolerans]|nr:citrate lyase holo-[acyl-carrier protein] synthase [Psychrilyobacter piezotolerans]MCS5422040.1 citrate lyase holo-[acyl-carrier protein] synthase [Psychrilyobacter sp. S5]
MDILDARENRAYLQEELIKKFNLPLLVIRANYPGIDKNNEVTKYIIEIMYETILSYISPINIKKIDSFEGIVYLLSIDTSPAVLKKSAVDMETTHPLGRLVDIDILDLNNHTLSRTDLGSPPRRCFICSSPAHNCVRSKKHSLEEILKHIENKVSDYKNLTADHTDRYK